MKNKTQEILSKNFTGSPHEGILPVNKQSGITAFDIVKMLRKLLGIKKIGHAGTLDPFAEGVMIMLIGRKYTRLSNQLMSQEKEYVGRVHLGVTTDTYDSDGKPIEYCGYLPSYEKIQEAIKHFQGEIKQIPPMFSAKKINGKKLYELARQGKTIERPPVTLHVQTDLVAYQYPYLDIRVICSKGTYIRSIAHDLGQLLQCGAHLSSLTRTRSGFYTLSGCVDGNLLKSSDLNLNDISSKIIKL